MSILVMILVGAIAGTIASYLMKSPTGLMTDIILGIVGAVVGGLVMGLFGAAGATGFDLYSILVSVIGAVIIIALARMFSRRSTI